MSWVITGSEKNPVDLYRSQVSLLLHGDGANGSNTITDNSPTPKTVTPAGNAQNSTAQFKFGGSSIAFDGSGDYLTLPANSSLEMGSGDFTIEFWLRPTSVAGNAHILAQQAQDFTVQFNGGFSDNLTVYDGTNRVIGAVSTSVWTHVALLRASGQLQGYLNGVASGSSWTNTSSSIFTLSSGYIGARWTGGFSYNGYIDDLRITKGIARYTANFTPPTAPFPDI